MKKQFSIQKKFNIRFHEEMNGWKCFKVETNEKEIFLVYNYIFDDDYVASAGYLMEDVLKDWAKTKNHKVDLPILSKTSGTRLMFDKKVWTILGKEIREILNLNMEGKKVRTYNFILPLVSEEIEQDGEKIEVVDVDVDADGHFLEWVKYDKNNNLRKVA